MIASPDKIVTRKANFPRALWITACIVVAATAALALSRVGLLDLPSVPSSLGVEAAGLFRDTEKVRNLDNFIRGAPDPRRIISSNLPEVEQPGWAARNGVDFIETDIQYPGQGTADYGLEALRECIRYEPDNLVISNVYRMETFRLRRAFLIKSRARGDLTPKFPAHLDRQPVAFFEELMRDHPSRETKLQLALAWVDEMLLFPALEIKAPSSVQSVDILSEILDEPRNEYYVPALFARGLNHLHRPARLVWPETNKTPPDAAVQDIAKCVAIGRKLNIGSKRLQSILAMTLGDAYVKAGRLNVARSWWQIAQNMCHDDDIQQAVRRRYSWGDEEILDQLEQELDRARLELDHPMTDLAMMWN